MSEFQKYLDLGWKLCKIEPGTKGPRTPGWNTLENALKSVEGIQGAGLLHALSGTCAIDIDDWALSEKFLAGHGIDLNELYTAPDAVTVSSGSEGRGKLLYRLPEPLATIKVADNKLEFRCASRDGSSVQDVLPPSIHPSGRKYTMTGDMSALPALPKALHAIWMAHLQPTEMSAQKTASPDKQPTATIAELKKLIIGKLDADMIHDEWNKIGMIIHFETGGSQEGFELFNTWSKEGKKYTGSEDLQIKWNSYGHGGGRPLTADSLRHQNVASVDDFKVVDVKETQDFMEVGKKKNPYLGTALGPDEWGDLPQPEWLITDIMPKKGLGSLWGPSGSGKSFVGIDLAIAVATGGMWRGLRLKPGRVGVIAAEDAFGYRARVEAALRARGLSTTAIKVIGATPRLHDAQERAWIAEEFQRVGPIDLLIVDTMAAATPGMDENSTADATQFIYDVRQMTELLDTMGLLIHHTGKDVSKGSRGSSAFKGTFDVEWEIEVTEKERKMHIAKMRNGPVEDMNGNGFFFPFKLTRFAKTCAIDWVV